MDPPNPLGGFFFVRLMSTGHRNPLLTNSAHRKIVPLRVHQGADRRHSRPASRGRYLGISVKIPRFACLSDGITASVKSEGEFPARLTVLRD